MREIKFEELTIGQKELIDSAAKVMENAYNPYSEFFVGAAIRAQNGDIITGANMENSAYGSSICAERSAILHANALGLRMFESIAIITRGKDFDSEEPSAPCGSCRQMIYESAQLSDRDIEIIMSNTKKTKIIVSTISELLPMAFGPKDVGMNVDKYRK